MSFSGDVKEELAQKIPQARHCQLAELAGLFHFCGQTGITDEGKTAIGFATERENVSRKGFTLLRKTFNIYTELPAEDTNLRDFFAKIGDPEETVSPLLIKNSCCKRAFLRGAFLATGSVSDPTKDYHLEIVCSSEKKASQLVGIIKEFDIDSKVVARRGDYVLYIKDGESIVNFLSVMEASHGLMDMENARIYKEVNNSVNRRMNCELSNIRKIVESAQRQKDDILYIREHMGLENLPEPLAQMAYARVEYPEMPLKELGKLLDPPVGKSGVNHRLQRLSEIAEKLREERGEAQHP